MITKFTEADVKTVGGLSRAERRIPGIMEMMALAVVAVPKFKEAVTAGGRGSLRRWLEAAETASRTRFREAGADGFVQIDDLVTFQEAQWPFLLGRIMGADRTYGGGEPAMPATPPPPPAARTAADVFTAALEG